MSLLTLEQVGLRFGGQLIVERLGLRVGDRDRIGLIGPNGSGKTTLLRIVAGEQSVDEGCVRLSRGVRIGYLAQDLHIRHNGTVIDFVLSSVPGRTDMDAELLKAEEALTSGTGDESEVMALATQVASLHERIADHEQLYAAHQAHRILAGLGFSNTDHKRKLSEFSGGWQMRAFLASLLFQQPDLLLLDEPTNHLDMPSVAWLSVFLKRYPRALVIISHDREFLNEQINRVVSFEPEGVRQYPGNYESYARQRAEEEILLRNRARNQEKERERMERFVERFKAKASKARQAQSRAKQLEKMETVEVLQLRKVMRIKFQPTPRTVNEVVRLEQVRKGFGSQSNEHIVFSKINLVAQRGERIGIIGANGAGKTTLLKLIGGELVCDSGRVVIGNGVKIGYYAQHHAETLDNESTVLAEVARVDPSASQTRVRSILGCFLFSGDAVDKPIGVLSGGERARVALARLLIKPGSLLLMDEPSNHLDLESTEALADSLSTYDGTLVFVSHNRSLIRKLATRIWNVQAGGVETYPGTLDEYMYASQQRLDRASDDASLSNPASSGPPRATKEGTPLRRAAAKESRDERKRRKRREAEARQAERGRAQQNTRDRILELEASIESLEADQRLRTTQLADPEVYQNAAVREDLLSAYQEAARKVEELSQQWERASNAVSD